MSEIYEQVKAPNGAVFKIQSHGRYWTLFVREPNAPHWTRVQSSVDAKFLSLVLHNQKEFR